MQGFIMDTKLFGRPSILSAESPVMISADLAWLFVGLICSTNSLVRSFDWCQICGQAACCQLGFKLECDALTLNRLHDTVAVSNLTLLDFGGTANPKPHRSVNLPLPSAFAIQFQRCDVIYTNVAAFHKLINKTRDF